MELNKYTDWLKELYVIFNNGAKKATNERKWVESERLEQKALTVLHCMSMYYTTVLDQKKTRSNAEYMKEAITEVSPAFATGFFK